MSFRIKNSVRPSVDDFIEQLTKLRFDCVFNPYADICPEHDKADAPAIRRRNLALTLEAALDCRVESLWIARDLGYRGGRRTGLALTDELHLASHAKLLRSGSLARSTKGPAVAERTATVIWQALNALEKPIFLWNVFPLHPHAPGSPMSNRCHTRAERQACRPLLMWLLENLRPRSVLAIGRDAQLALVDLKVEAVQIRHPSFGGQREFLDAVSSHYRV
jgi:uracil-DNA glycosylase